MNEAKIKEELLDIMLRAAVNDDLKEELREIPQNDDLPQNCELSASAKSKINKLIKKSYYHSMLLHFRTISQKVSVIVIMIVSISFVSLLSVSASRHAIFNALLDWKSNHVDIHYQVKTNNSRGKVSQASDYQIKKPQYLPSGYAEAQISKMEHEIVIEYKNADSNTILFRQCPLSDQGNMGIDTDHTTALKKIDINGQKASLFRANYSGETSYLVWNNGSSSFLLSSSIDVRQLIKIADSIE